MKYTRYNTKPKKKQSNNILFYLALTLLLALVLGTFAQKILLQEGNGIWFEKAKGQDGVQQETQSESGNGDNKNNGGVTANEGSEDENKNGEVVKEKYNFYLLQCGVFKVEENANKVVEKLKLYGKPFTEVEGELTKVYFGIYSDENVATATEMLNSNGIDNSKVTITVPVEDLSTGQLCKLAENMIEVMNKTCESGVKSLKTTDIKAWVDTLEPIESNMKQYTAVEEIKAYINDLPEEVDNNSLQDGMKMIYDKIKAYK